MKRKKLPAFVKNPLLVEFFQSRLGRIFSNWVLQGMLYMNKIEIAYKLALDLLFTLLIVLFVLGGDSLLDWLFALMIAHTLNWILNGQPVALLMHIDIGKNNANKFISYIENLEKRIVNKDYLAACAAYGSLSVGNYKPTSDIDIRVILKKDLISQLLAAHFCFIERVKAFLAGFPLDLYAFTLEEAQVKMSPKEPPIVFLDPEGQLRKIYPELIEFKDFQEHFRAVVLPEQENK